jgi:hypothetical protein
MSDPRGRALQNALANYLTQWFPHAESAGAGRQGTDVLGTPGVVWECKTARNFKDGFRPKEGVEQSKRHILAHDLLLAPDNGRFKPPLPVTVYFPNGTGIAKTEHALGIMPLHVLMQLLKEAGYTG